MPKKSSKLAIKTTSETVVDDDKIPALFATIHWKSDERPDGYTPEEVEEMNRIANKHLEK